MVGFFMIVFILSIQKSVFLQKVYFANSIKPKAFTHQLEFRKISKDWKSTD